MSDLRDKFFKDLTRERDDGLKDFNCMPHNVFEWIRENILSDDEWVSIDDRKPELGQGVLICLNTGLITIGYRKEKGEIYDWQLFGDVETTLVVDLSKDFVTDWRPIPGAPIKQPSPNDHIGI